MLGAQSGGEGVVGLEPPVVVDQVRQGAALRQVPGGVAVALGLGAVERVLDQGSTQQRRRERLRALQLPCCRVEQVIEVAVDLGVAVEHETGRLPELGPCLEEVERDREAPEAERVRHCPLLGDHVLEVGQCLEIGTQALDRKALLEGRPAEPLSLLGPAGRDQRVKVGALPPGLMPLPSEDVEVVQVAAPDLLPRPACLKGGDGLLAPARPQHRHPISDAASGRVRSSGETRAM